MSVLILVSNYAFQRRNRIRRRDEHAQAQHWLRHAQAQLVHAQHWPRILSRSSQGGAAPLASFEGVLSKIAMATSMAIAVASATAVYLVIVILNQPLAKPTTSTSPDCAQVLVLIQCTLATCTIAQLGIQAPVCSPGWDSKHLCSPDWRSKRLGILKHPCVALGGDANAQAYPNTCV